MTKLRKTLLAATSLVLGTSLLLGNPLLAQTEDKVDDEVTAPSETIAKLSPGEMKAESEVVLKGMEDALTRVTNLQQVARKQKDIIKLNCVNDKLLQIKKLINIADSGHTNMIEAIAQTNDEGAAHSYSKITISSETVSSLRDEAEGCIGEELVFLGPTEVDVDEPVIPDDPTGDGEYNFDDILEPPGFASPFS